VRHIRKHSSWSGEMTSTKQPRIRLFQFPRLYSIPNLSPFCSKLETWLRIAGIPYDVVDTSNPRKSPKGKLPFIEDAGLRIGDTSLIIAHLKKTRRIDPDAQVSPAQQATALLVQRTLEEHYAFVVLYTHFIRDQGWWHTRLTFDAVPALIRPLVARMVRRQMRKILWVQGVLRHSDRDILEAGMSDWRAVLAVMSDGPFFFGERPTTTDAIVFATLATTVLTPIESPIRDFLQSHPTCISYAERLRSRLFPELAAEAASTEVRETSRATGQTH
jgi:glutathione S-transferase